jgi:hypothetical protein
MKTSPASRRSHPEYLILSLTRKKISLIRVVDSHPIEINDEAFPMTYSEEYEYSKSSAGTSFGYALKGFEKDKSVVTESRFITFLREANVRLRPYLKKDVPLIIAGVKKELGDFETITNQKDRITSRVHGSYSTYNRNDLVQKATELVQEAVGSHRS